MIQKITLLLFLTLFALSLSYAADQNAQNKNAAAAQTSKLAGVVDKIDLNTKTISFRQDGSKQLQEIAFSESTVFQKQNGTARAEDLKQGDHVIIEVDSTNTITRLQLQPADQAENKQQ